MNKSLSSSAASDAAISSSMNEDIQNNNNDSAKYRGVRKRKWGKWVSEIRLPNSRERIWLGSFDSPEKAARAFDAALFCLRGNNANFNFPNQPPNIPGGRDLHPSQIQAVAAHFANSYQYSSTSLDHEIMLQQVDHESEELVSCHDHDDDYMMQYSSSNSMDVHHHHHHVVMDDDHSSCINNIPDFGIFPGFDDYFMPPLTTIHDYGEELAYDGVYSQDPSFLWSF